MELEEALIQLKSILRDMTYDMYAALYTPSEDELNEQEHVDVHTFPQRMRSRSERIRDIKYAHADQMINKSRQL